MHREKVIGFIFGLAITLIGVLLAHFLTQRSQEIETRQQEAKTLLSVQASCDSIRTSLSNGIVQLQGRGIQPWPGDSVFFKSIDPSGLNQRIYEAAKATLITGETASLFNLGAKNLSFIHHHLTSFGPFSSNDVNVRNMKTYIEYLSFFKEMASIEIAFINSKITKEKRSQMLDDLLQQNDGMGLRLTSLPSGHLMLMEGKTSFGPTLQSDKKYVLQSGKRFVLYSDKTVLDLKTKLLWAAESSPGSKSWEEAVRYCSDFDAGGYKDWRMPTIDELRGIYNAGARYGSGDQSECPINVGWWVWTSKTEHSNAFYINFYPSGQYKKCHYCVLSHDRSDTFYKFCALPVRQSNTQKIYHEENNIVHRPVNPVHP